MSELPVSATSESEPTATERLEGPEEPLRGDEASSQCWPRTKLFIFLILKLVSTVLIIWDSYSDWKLFHNLRANVTHVPGERQQSDLIIAWGFFAAVGVLTALLMIWDMLIEALEDFEKVPFLKGKRMDPHWELALVSFVEEIPQAVIVVWVLANYKMTLATESVIRALLKETVFDILLDVLSIIFRILSTLNKLRTVIAGVYELRYKRHRLLHILVLVLDVLAVACLLVLTINSIILEKNFT